MGASFAGTGGLSAGVEPKDSHAAASAIIKIQCPQSFDGLEFGTTAPVASYTRVRFTFDNSKGPMCAFTMSCLPSGDQLIKGTVGSKQDAEAILRSGPPSGAMR